MFYRTLLVAACLCVAQLLIAQNVRLAYFGENITHYGLRSGLEYSLHSSQKSKGNFSIQNSLTFGVNLTIFRHPDNHIGIILSPELGWRRTGKRGGIVQAALSTGLFRSIYEGTTYKANENGGFEKVSLGGQWGFLPGVSVGFGKDFSVNGNMPMILFANVHYMHHYPYNRTYLIRPALEAGIIFKNNN
ncbi:MAG: hypothetical protein SFU99_22830 [Saprospiraceae bacterium]|nr:hypothetical protein [Saprospiraceae bacterium]